MFWRAARGRVGPNSRSVLHMAIFLLNSYGLYACILIPKLLASSPELSGFASSPELSKLARKARTPLPAVTLPKAESHMPIGASVRFARAGWKRSTSSSRHHMAQLTAFLALASLAPNPEHYMPIGVISRWKRSGVRPLDLCRKIWYYI